MKIFLLGLLLALFSFASAHAVDMTQPAQIQITVQDMAGHLLPQATVILGTEVSAHGNFLIRSPQPASDIFWTEHLRVTMSGCLPYEGDIHCFPGAQIAIPIILYPLRTTRLQLRSPKGEAIAGMSIEINYVTLASEHGGPIHGDTDKKGDYIFIHPPFKSGFGLTVGSNIRNSNYPDAPIVTATLTLDEMSIMVPARPLALTLIAPDGAPEAGWQVASHVNASGSWGGFSSVIFLNGFTNGYAVSGLNKTDKEGRIRIPQADDKLVVISPQGIPFLYPLSPQTWPDGPHSVTLRLPPVRRMQTGILTYMDGKPAANVLIDVNRAHTGTENWQVQSKEATESLLTDANGRFTLPQYCGTS